MHVHGHAAKLRVVHLRLCHFVVHTPASSIDAVLVQQCLGQHQHAQTCANQAD